MRVAYVTPFDARSLLTRDNWSGTGYYIAQAMKKQSICVDYMGPLVESLFLKSLRKFKSRWYKCLEKGYLKDTEPLIYQDYARQVSEKLSHSKSDIVFSAASNPVAFLECTQPIVFWADATFANLIDFYPLYSNLCTESLENAHFIEKLSLQKAKLAIFSSEWAAQTAINYYKADPAKVKVIPFGANVESNFSIGEIKTLISSRPTNQCRLLFLGIDWFRKGGDVALKVAQELNDSGLPSELTIVGCDPVVEGSIPDFVKPLGYISKSKPEGKKKIYQLIADSHFLILPSLADCTPIVFCEANSLGVPCLSRKVGGIPTMIRDGVNGQLFDQDAEISEYCHYIAQTFTDYSNYKNLALSSFHEYESRLNWTVAGKKVKELLLSLM